MIVTTTMIKIFIVMRTVNKNNNTHTVQPYKLYQLSIYDSYHHYGKYSNYSSCTKYIGYSSQLRTKLQENVLENVRNLEPVMLEDSRVSGITFFGEV